ncbi:MAG: UDP-N-acetylglucosamine pyrophosphorylase [Clostridia bacterium]|nr:UDP-N-acetylglucosamine pyrophosphorylase [Clostridia bacterium]
MLKLVKTKELYEVRTPYLAELLNATEYPWQALPNIKSYIKGLLENPPAGFTLYAEGVLVGEGVSIAATATILPPCVIGHRTEIRPGAYIRGNVITGSDCVIGNSTELKNCVLLEHVQVPHYNYVGDSVLGNNAHMGAGAICSNFKADGANIVVRGDENYETGLRKFGAMLGDGADIGCGCVLNPGTVIGKKTSVYPLTSVRGVIPADCIVKAMDNVVKRRPKA